MESNFVDVWHGSLLQPYDDIDSLSAMLSEQERLKATTFKNDDMRRRYIAVRAKLRRIIASYLKSDPAELQFKVAEHGKPYLACGSVHFNLSHTANHLVIAVADFPDIGIDIEEAKSRNNFDSLAERCFSVAELRAWRLLAPDEREQAFYRLWVKKEAFVKAVGRGLALGLQLCEVELAAGGQLKAVPSDYGAAADWLVTEVVLGPSVHSALVMPWCQFKLRMRLLDSDVNF